MSRSAARARAAGDRTSLYQQITDKITAELETGRVPWVQPWGTLAAKASLSMPKNAATQRHYSGINVLILWGAVIERGFAGQAWVTFRQALGLGGHVRKGERGTTVVYADRFISDEERRRAEETGEEPEAIPFLKRFTVFNTDQCEDLPREVVSAPSPVPEGLMVPQAEVLIAATGADFRIGGDRAFYSRNYDFIQVPRPDAYFEPINWHRTALHELGHWTGAAQRLDRDLSGSFGSKKYAQEELVAEITSAFVCAMRMSDDPAPGDYDDYYIASILGSESSTFRLDQAILFATCDALERDALEKAISRTPQVDHWFASDFDGAIMFDEGDAVQHAAGEESECRAHDNLNAIPQAASVGDKAAA